MPEGFVPHHHKEKRVQKVKETKVQTSHDSVTDAEEENAVRKSAGEQACTGQQTSQDGNGSVTILVGKHRSYRT